MWNRTNRSKPAPAVHYVCPPGLVNNVRNEFDKWLVPDVNRPTLLADTRLKGPPDVGEGAVLFIDEAQRFNNAKTKRTQAVFDYARPFARVILMGGDPLPNSRPRELWAILRRFAPDVFGLNERKFLFRFCNPTQETFYSSEGEQTRWRFDGFSNRAEFKARITQSFMLRIRKEDVAEYLPPRTEELLTVGDDMPAVVSRLEQKVLQHFTTEDVMEGRVVAAAGGVGAVHFSTYLKMLGEYKLRYFLPYLRYVLDETNENVLVVARHLDTIAELARLTARYDPLVITGAVPPKRRVELVAAWQAAPARRLAMVNDAGTIGLNMQKVDRVLLLEASWRPGDNGQAIDRAHRLGREGAVRAQYVVLKGSMDARRMGIILDKRQHAV